VAGCYSHALAVQLVLCGADVRDFGLPVGSCHGSDAASFTAILTSESDDIPEVGLVSAESWWGSWFAGAVTRAFSATTLAPIRFRTVSKSRRRGATRRDLPPDEISSARRTGPKMQGRHREAQDGAHCTPSAQQHPVRREMQITSEDDTSQNCTVLLPPSSTFARLITWMNRSVIRMPPRA